MYTPVFNIAIVKKFYVTVTHGRHDIRTPEHAHKARTYFRSSLSNDRVCETVENKNYCKLCFKTDFCPKTRS